MRPSPKILALFAFSLLVILAAPFVGGEPIHLTELWLPGSPTHRIVFELRIPRLVVALVGGGSLAVLGATYQILFHNPLAEPYILGVSSAVTLGVAIAEIVFHLPAYSYWGPVVGTGAAIAITLLMLSLFRSGRGESASRIVLFGMGVNFVLSSLLFLLLSYTYQSVGGGSLRWLFGQIPWVTGREAAVFTVLDLSLVAWIALYGRALDGLSLGDGVARTLGIAPQRARRDLLLLCSLLVSLVVSFTGAIGFVGLVTPHVIRLAVRPSGTRALFGLAFLCGAIFLVLSDLLSRSLVPPLEFPIGIITTLVGGPAFLWLLWRRQA